MLTMTIFAALSVGLSLVLYVIYRATRPNPNEIVRRISPDDIVREVMRTGKPVHAEIIGDKVVMQTLETKK